MAAVFEDLLSLEPNLRHFNEERWPECSLEEKPDMLIGHADIVPCGLERFGQAGYIIEHGIFYHLPNSTANESRRWPFDWYLSHVQDPTVRLAFPPLEFAELSVEVGGCTAQFNAEHPLPSGRPWCNEVGRFVPSQCEGPEGNCGELYHTQPGWMEGAVEALIVTHKLPYEVVYIGFEEHARLLERQVPFIALGWDPGRWEDGAKRVQFPIAMSCDHSHDGNPETPHPCDTVAKPSQIYVAPSLRAQVPAVSLFLDRLVLVHSDMEALLHMSSTEVDSPACEYLRQNRAAFVDIAGRCVSADQPLNEEGTDCSCPDGLVWNDTANACTACPPNAFCFRARAFPCGDPYGIAGVGRNTSQGFISSPGRRRRAQGPDVPDDCICAPGYGLANDFEPLTPGSQPTPVCQPCPEDFYKSQWAAGTCTDACPPFSEANDGGASDESDCTCRLGYYLARRHPLLCKVCPLPEQRDEPPGIVCFGSMKTYNAETDRMETRSVEPYALPGWVMVETGSVDSANGRAVVGEPCPTRSSCLGNNTCVLGTHGPLCSVCMPGYVQSSSMVERCSACDNRMARHAAVHVASFVGLTLYVNSQYSIISGDGAKKASLLSMISKLIYHNAFLTWPVATYPLWVAWTAPQASILDGWVFHQRCLLMHLGVQSRPGQALVVAFSVIFFPALALLGSFLWCRLRVVCNARSFARAQVEVDRTGQLLNMCDWLEDLEVRNNQRMVAIKDEFRRHQRDRINSARVSHIWRILKRPGTNDGIYRMFLDDSVGLVILWMVVLYPLVTAEIISSFQWWRPPGWTGEQIAFGTTMVYFGDEHLPLLVFGALFCCFYCCGFPLLCLLRIKKFFQERKLLQGTQYIHWGYLQYTFQLRSPAIYTEVMHMFEQTFMALMVNEASLDSPLFVSSVQQPIIMLFLVLHCWSAPYDKIAYGILHKLMGLTVLVCALTAEVSGYDRRGYVSTPGFDVSQFVSTVNSVVDSVNNREVQFGFAPIFLAVNMTCIMIFNIVFWFLVITGGGRELLHQLYSLMYLFSAKDTGLLWDKITTFRPLRWFGNFYEAVLDLLMVAFRLATHSKSQCLSVTMEMKQGSDRFTREIVVHEQQRKKLRRNQSADSAGPKRPKKGSRKMRARKKDKRGTAQETAKALGKGEEDTRQRVLDRRDRGNMALALSEAMETLLVVHGLNSLPCCIIEFILADALYFVHKGPREERRQRQSIFSFVWKHGSGQVRGLEQLFEGGSSAPVLSSNLRLQDLRSTALRLSTEAVTDSLLISDLQRYVRHLRFEDPQAMENGIKTFTEAFHSSHSSGLSGDKRVDSATQTSFLVHQAVQVENMSTQETQTVGLIKRANSQQEPNTPSTPTAEAMHEEMLVLREEAAAALRESELLLSEVVDSLEGTAKSSQPQGPRWTPGRRPPKPDNEELPVGAEPQGPLWAPKRPMK